MIELIPVTLNYLHTTGESLILDVVGPHDRASTPPVRNSVPACAGAIGDIKRYQHEQNYGRNRYFRRPTSTKWSPRLHVNVSRSRRPAGMCLAPFGHFKISAPLVVVVAHLSYDVVLMVTLFDFLCY